MHKAPEIIWLQIDPEGDIPTGTDTLDGVTWCKDKINDTDVKYVRSDTLTARELGEVSDEPADNSMCPNCVTPWKCNGLHEL